MAKTKAELESDAAEYRHAVSEMRQAHRDGRFLEAIEIAFTACDYVDGMMQFERRFEGRNERKTVETIAYILQHAPLVFDRKILESLGTLLKSQKRIDKNATADLADELRDAVALMWDAHRLWSILEQEAEVAQNKLRTNFGGDQDRWRSIAESWERMGLVKRVPEQNSYRISLATRMTAQVRGKCSTCGATGKAAMEVFLAEVTCPRCKATSSFVILPSDSNRRSEA